MKYFKFVSIFVLVVVNLFPENKINDFNICKETPSKFAVIFVEKSDIKKDYCYSCHLAELPTLQWVKLIKFFRDKNIPFYFLGNIERKELKVILLKKNLLRYFVKGYYTILCEGREKIYEKEGDLDMIEFERIIKIINKQKPKTKN